MLALSPLKQSSMTPIGQFNFIWSAITQFLIYTLLNIISFEIMVRYVELIFCYTDFRNDLFMLSYKLAESFALDVINISNRPNQPEAAGWPIPQNIFQFQMLIQHFNSLIDQQVIQRGFMFEQHKITTDDGYILTAFRIPGRFFDKPLNGQYLSIYTILVLINGKKKQKKQYPVYMQHGLIDDGGTWFFNNETVDLSLILADLGYDVWITNSRGTVNQHTKYKTKDTGFWEFSLHEMGKYDVPANLNYILDKTGAEKVIYIGHSQGTTQWFIANALYESMNEIKSLSKFMRIFTNTSSLLSDLLQSCTQTIFQVYLLNFQLSVAARFLDLMKIPDLFYEYLNHVLYLPNISSLGSQLLNFLPRTSWSVVQGITGFDDRYHVQLSNLPMMAQNDVGGTSTRNTLHWIQMVRSQRFQMFDYGSQGNRRHYNGRATPPEYDVSSFRRDMNDIKMLLFYGEHDSLLSEKAFSKLLKVLPLDAEVVTIRDYNHVDYMWAADCNKYVNDHVLDFLEKHQL